MIPFQLQKDEEAQGLVEYSLILLLIAIAVVAAIGFLGDAVVVAFEQAVDAFS